MFCPVIAVSTNDDIFQAAKEVSASAKIADLKAVFAYCSCEYDVKALIEAIGNELGVPVFGNTSFTGVITPDGFFGGDKPFVGIMALADPDLTVGVAALPKEGCSVKRGKELAADCMKAAGKDCAPDYFYMAASPAEEEFYLRGISSVIGRVPFFGGSAADNTIEGKWSLYADGKCFPDGCIAAFFYGGPKMCNLFTGAYRETDDFGIITKVSGNRNLVEIDGIPAADKYMAWRNLDREAVTGGNLLVTTITSPLGIKDRLGRLIAIRHPMNGNPDGSFDIGANLAEKTVVIRMEATVDELIASTGATLGKILLGGRRNGAFYEPTVIGDVPKDADVAIDMEIFGPVVPIIAFDTEEEAIEIANRSIFGLCGCVFTENMKTAARVANALECGGAVINGASFFRSFEMPFGGYKHSGIGTEGVFSTFNEMTHTKSIVLKNIL